MRGLVVILLMLAVIASFSFIAYSSDSGKSAENPKQLEFSTFTSAVCENKGNFVHCRDELFVNCDGKIAKANELSECNGIKVETPKILGFAVFEKDWKDSRN